MDHLLFLTGRLALPALERVLGELADPSDPARPFDWTVHEPGLQVAALMTAEMIARRLPRERLAGIDRVIVPGRCRGDLEALAQALGRPVQRGPEELKDLPAFFRRAARPVPLHEHRVAIFAEITDAPRLTLEALVARAQALAGEGADVIDLGGLPGTPFPQLEAAVQALKARGLKVSVDSQQPDELLRGGRAGADYLLSLTPELLWIADEVAATPVLVGATPDDEAGLWASVEWLQARGRAFLADPILDPIPFGLARSIVRYHRLRERFPDAPMLMGTGNLTELTEADTSGIHAVLLGLCAELDIRAILTTQVSPHARRALREADAARRLMHAAATLRTLPKDLGGGLATVHERRPWPDSPQEIAATAAQVRDPNFRIQVAADGLHVYNRDGLRHAQDAMSLWPRLGLGDAPGDAAHAFYLGAELARAEIAWQLGKRYVQDRPLDWGVAADAPPEDLSRACAPGATMAPTALERHAARRTS